MIRCILGEVLRGAGHRVREVADGQEAYDAIRADCPDLLITDWCMPEVDGVELCRRLRQAALPRYLYIVMLTAKSEAVDLLEGMQAGVDIFLGKPIRGQELLAKIQWVAGRRTSRVPTPSLS